MDNDLYKEILHSINYKFIYCSLHIHVASVCTFKCTLGYVCFFPSQDTGTWFEILKKKHIVCEPRAGDKEGESAISNELTDSICIVVIIVSEYMYIHLLVLSNTVQDCHSYFT